MTLVPQLIFCLMTILEPSAKTATPTTPPVSTAGYKNNDIVQAKHNAWAKYEVAESKTTPASVDGGVWPPDPYPDDPVTSILCGDPGTIRPDDPDSCQ